MVKPTQEEEAKQAAQDDEYSLPKIPEEEITKMTLDEGLSEADRIKVLLSKKDQPSTQQAYVFHNAVNIFSGNPDGVQQEIIPLILKQMGTFGESLQIEAGKALTLLLDQEILEACFFKDLKNTCIVMLKQWSKPILAEWIQVYTSLIPQMLSKGDYNPKLIQECISNCQQMSEPHQPTSVRMASADLIGLIAQKQIIVVDEFERLIFPKVVGLAQDRSWEVHGQMSKNIIQISKFLGHDKTNQLILPLLKKLIFEESEQEVQRKAISSLFKHVLYGLFGHALVNGEDFFIMLKKILNLGQSSGTHQALKNTLIKKLPKIITLFDPSKYGDDHMIEQTLSHLLHQSRKTELGRLNFPEFLSSLTHLYTHNGKWVTRIFAEGQDFLINETKLQGLNKDVKVAIASQLHNYLICSMTISIDKKLSEEVRLLGTKATFEIIGIIQTIMGINNKEIVNQFVSRGCYPILEFVHSNAGVLDKGITSLIYQYIKEPLFTSVDSILISNWRYHLAYFEQFLSKYLVNLSDKDEATMIVFPLMLRGASDSKSSMPVKRYIAHFCADVIVSKANMYLRLCMQESIIKDFAQSQSSQLRQVFMFFLEQLVTHVSAEYFKAIFLEAYLQFGENETVQSLLTTYIKLVPEARKRVATIGSIERLENSLHRIIKGHTGKHISLEVVKLAKETFETIRSPQFQSDLHLYQHTLERELEQKEHHLRDLEKSDQTDQNPVKKRRMELFIQTLVGEGFKKGIKIVGGAGPSTPTINTKNPILNRLQAPVGGNRTPGLAPPTSIKLQDNRPASSGSSSRNGAGVATSSTQPGKTSSFKPTVAKKI